MRLQFCCPSCGAVLRVDPASAVLVSCPACGEPIRVPRHQHPRETAPADTPALPDDARRRVLHGLHLLSASVWAFVSAGGCVALSFLLRVLFAKSHPPEFPPWLPPVQVTLAGGWLALALGGCVCRLRGYLLCRAAADVYSLGGWVKAAAGGSMLAVAGVVGVVPAVIGRPTLELPAVGVGLVMFGLAAGFVGVVVEFAFLSVLNRLLWETLGWATAERTGRYAVEYVFALAAAVASVCLGAMAVILTAEPGEAEGVRSKAVAVAVLAAECVIGGWVTWRFARLLRLARHALARPEPEREPVG